MIQKFEIKDPFQLENGEAIDGVEVAYMTRGQLNVKKDNVIWICHALTANADAEEWWPGLVGNQNLIDPEKYFIVCANILGSCYGSTFAGSKIPGKDKIYGKSFPLLTVRDQVKSLDILRQHLGIDRVKMCIGASLGGHQVVEWAISRADVFDRICLIATNCRHSPWGIAFNKTQRMALEADPTLYADKAEAGWKGMAAARAIAMLSYRNYKTYQYTQSDDADKIEHFKAASYQQYQGEKLCKRFHPLAYMSLSKMMDTHNVGRGRGGTAAALSLIRAQTLVIGIESDILFPLSEQEYLARKIPNAFLKVINSKYGHDGFLIEYDLLTDIIGEFLLENI